MNGAILLMLNVSSLKKMTMLVIATMIVILALPVGAVLALSNLPLSGFIDSGSTNNGLIYDEPITPGDAYDYGYCTYWAALRRIQVGHQIPNNWGDAITWGIRATLAGYRVDHTPEVGSVFQWPEAPGGLGHVAYVEKVDPDTGAWTISEMNAVGWDVVDERTYPASQAKFYNFIHDKELLHDF